MGIIDIVEYAGLNEIRNMTKKSFIPNKYQIWIDVRKRYHLTDSQVQMARELGLNPHKFGKLANEEQESWKLPLPEFIEEIYWKRFGKRQPDSVRSIEQVVRYQREKKAERKARKNKPDQEQEVGDNTEKASNEPLSLG
jgi:hypothetical protein